MTTYEKLTLIVSIMAIVVSVAIPLIQYILRKIKQLKLTILPFDHTPLRLFFNESGSYIKFKFSLECKNQPATIHSIRARVIRDSDGGQLDLIWSTAESVYVNWFGPNAANRINSVSIVHPLKVLADTLEPMIIEFSNCNQTSILNACSQRDDIINKALQQWHPEKIDELITILHEEGNLEQLKPSLIESNFWKAGTYKLYLDIQYNTSKILTTTFCFSISDTSEHTIKNNTQAILLCQIYKQSNLPCPYRFEFVDTEISQIPHAQ